MICSKILFLIMMELNMKNLSRIIVFLFILLLVSCVPEANKKCKENEVLQNGVCVINGQNLSCGDTPNNGTESRTAYSVSSVPSSQSCSTYQQSQTRTCTNGVWSAWSGTYQNLTCTVQAASACGNTASGGTESRIAYSLSSVPYGQSCSTYQQSQTRTCTNGVWSAWSGVYQNLTCTVQAASACGSTANGGTESRIAYSVSSVPSGQSCSAYQQSQTRTCTNGVWSAWSGTYQNLTCVQSASACGNTASGAYELRTMYQVANVSEGSTCVSQIQQRLCTNGQFGSWSGTYTQTKCTVSRVRYEQATVAVAGGCHPETQLMTCEAGLCGAWVPNHYSYASCVVAAGAGCTQVSFSWTPNTESILLGYKIHQGDASMTFTKHHDVGLPATVNNLVGATVTGVFESGKTYYFAATAYGSGNVESGYSAQVSWTCLE